MYEDSKSKISQLEKVLDSMGDKVPNRTTRHELPEHENKINQNWDDNEFKVGNEVFSGTSKSPKSTSLAMKILIGSAIFFIVALLVVIYNFWVGGNLVSGDNIEVTIKAPISITGGEVWPFEVEIKNKNNVTLSDVDMGITFPLGAKQVDDPSVSAKRIQEFLGDILPNQSLKKNKSIILLGNENEKKEITITLEYKVAGSNSLFNKTKVVSVLISSSPVSIVITGPTEVNTNQTVNFTVDITSNSPTLMKNLLLKVDYPFGFIFSESNPKFFSKNNLWLIGDLEPGAKRTIKFSGALNGQEGEERGFNFSLGPQSSVDNLSLDLPLTTYFSSVTIRRPFVSADISLNGLESNEYVSRAGNKVDAVIKWRNNLSYEVSDVSIIVRINGNSVNKSSIQVNGGYYRSVDNTIIFDKMTDSNLANLEPGQSGSSRFSFSSFSAGSVTGLSLSNPTITLDFSVSGRRIDFENGEEDVLFSDSRKIKITSDAQMFAKILYYIGPFQNSGPIPPKAETETTYTITWTITNPLNNLNNVRVNATLPPYVKWLSKVSPTQENINYDEGTGLVSWNVGNISAGAGTISSAKEVSFQISLLPSVDQIGTSPSLIGEASLSARDVFTLTEVTDSFSALNTDLSNDPYFRNEGGKVIQ